jgi:phosphoribosylformylglycinamidine synthase
MRIDLDRVPARESGMTAYELMLSESQERMLVVAEKGREAEVQNLFEKWDLHAAIIGEVTDTGRVAIDYQGECVADVPAEPLVLGGGAPVYIRDAREPAYISQARSHDLSAAAVPEDLKSVLVRILASPNIASKRWVYEQYDSMVRTNNVLLSTADAAVIQLKSGNRGLAVKTDCNSRYVYLNPRLGGMIAVAEAARNVVCTGALPVAITNCLNFGNPYKPEVYWQFREAVAGIGEACRALDTPVTGGNVSFYNEGPTASVYPTPVIGMLGIIDDLRHVTGAGFRNEGDAIVLLGETAGHIGGSEYLSVIHNIVAGDAPALNLDFEHRLQQACLAGIRAGLLNSAHDCSEGGLAVALAEACILDEPRLTGAVVDAGSAGMRADHYWFGEDQSRIVVSASPANVAELLRIAAEHGVHASVIGRVGGSHLVLGKDIKMEVMAMAGNYYRALADMVDPITT